jgi:hypothetical protein
MENQYKVESPRVTSMELHQILLQHQGEPVWSASDFSAEPRETSIEFYQILLQNHGG